MDDELTRRMDEGSAPDVDDDDALAQTQWVASRAPAQTTTAGESHATAAARPQPIVGEPTEHIIGESTQRIAGEPTEHMIGDSTQRMDDEQTQPFPGNPDRETTYVHFGPGVPVAPPPDRATAIWRGGGVEVGAAAAGTGSTGATTARTPRAGGQRWILPLTVLILVVAIVVYFLFGRSTTSMSISNVSVRTSAARVACSGQETLTGVVTTNGGAGVFSYQWLRSDGTKSAVLRQTVDSGSKLVDVTLVWNFDGIGSMHATAELDILAPGSPRKATASFDYSCSG